MRFHWASADFGSWVMALAVLGGGGFSAVRGGVFWRWWIMWQFLLGGGGLALAEAGCFGAGGLGGGCFGGKL